MYTFFQQDLQFKLGTRNFPAISQSLKVHLTQPSYKDDTAPKENKATFNIHVISIHNSHIIKNISDATGESIIMHSTAFENVLPSLDNVTDHTPKDFTTLIPKAVRVIFVFVGGIVTVVRVSPVMHDKLVIITGQFNGKS